MASPSPLATLIRSARLRQGLTQDQVALKALVPALKYQRLERGFYLCPRPELVNPVCRVLQVPVAVVLSALGYDLTTSSHPQPEENAHERGC